MTETVNKITDQWLQERSQAPLDKMKDWVSIVSKPLVDAVQDRIGVAKAGKRFLDDGGEPAELAVLAKKMSHDAVAADWDIRDRISEVVALYKETASRLQAHTGGLGPLGRLSESYAERAESYAKALAAMGKPPETPPMSDVEWDATRLVQLRQAKAQLGLGPEVGQVDTGRSTERRREDSFLLCLDDDSLQIDAGVRTGSKSSQKSARLEESIEALLRELFKLQDLKDDGLLGEDELVKLNEKIAMLHYGKDVDKSAVREKFRALFRSRLDASGQPVDYVRFQEYMVGVLREIDTDLTAQEMILEQFVAEANSARAVFHHQSFASASDLQFLPLTPSVASLPKAMDPTVEDTPSVFGLRASGPLSPKSAMAHPEQSLDQRKHVDDTLLPPSVFDLPTAAVAASGQNALCGRETSRSQSKQSPRCSLYRAPAVDEAYAASTLQATAIFGTGTSAPSSAGGVRELADQSRRVVLAAKDDPKFESGPSTQQSSKPLLRDAPTLDESREKQSSSDGLPSSGYAREDAARNASSRRNYAESQRVAQGISSRLPSNDAKNSTGPQSMSNQRCQRLPYSAGVPASCAEAMRTPQGEGRLIGIVGGDGSREPRYIS